MKAFVARQPIFDRNMEVFGYELLFRTSLENVFPKVDGDRATSAVISDSMYTFDMNTLIRGKRAFINFTRNLLLDEFALLLPKDLLVVEILEDVGPDSAVVEAARDLKEKGYMLALDDYERKDVNCPLVALADIVKIDFKICSPEERKQYVDSFKPRKIRLLAEKVETHDEFEAAKAMGYELFQGYFFCKPTVLQKTRPPEFKLSRIQLLQAVNEPVLDFKKVEEIIKHDVAFNYRLLKYINSAFFGLRNEVTSINQALVLLGQKNLSKWASLMVYSIVAEDKPVELLVTAIVRARFCELVAIEMGMAERGNELFLLGMLSTMDALLDMSMEEAMEEIPLAKDLKEALLGQPGQLRDILDVAIGYETGNWGLFDTVNRFSGLDEEALPRIRIEALNMAEDFLKLEKK